MKLDINNHPVVTLGQRYVCSVTNKQFIAARDGCSVNYAWGPNNEIISDEGVDLNEKIELLARKKPFSCYVNSDGKRVTGWKGNVHGSIVFSRSGRVGFCRDGLYVNVIDVYGNSWHGKNAGRGMCIRLRPTKG